MQVPPQAPSEYETAIIEKHLKETIISASLLIHPHLSSLLIPPPAHAQALYMNKSRIEYPWRTVVQKRPDGYSAFVIVYDGTVGSVDFQILARGAENDTMKAALESLLHALQVLLARQIEAKMGTRRGGL
jgi:hypothetical protein